MKSFITFAVNTTTLQRQCITALGVIVRDAVLKELDAEAGRRGSQVTIDDVASIVVPDWLHSALGQVEATYAPTILGLQLYSADQNVISVRFKPEAA